MGKDDKPAGLPVYRAFATRDCECLTSDISKREGEGWLNCGAVEADFRAGFLLSRVALFNSLAFARRFVTELRRARRAFAAATAAAYEAAVAPAGEKSITMAPAGARTWAGAPEARSERLRGVTEAGAKKMSLSAASTGSPFPRVNQNRSALPTIMLQTAASAASSCK